MASPTFGIHFLFLLSPFFSRLRNYFENFFGPPFQGPLASLCSHEMVIVSPFDPFLADWGPFIPFSLISNNDKTPPECALVLSCVFDQFPLPAGPFCFGLSALGTSSPPSSSFFSPVCSTGFPPFLWLIRVRTSVSFFFSASVYPLTHPEYALTYLIALLWL